MVGTTKTQLLSEESSKDDSSFSTQGTASQNGKKEQGHGITFTTRVAIAFLAVSLMTILAAVGMLSFVWEQHYQTYTRDNMERVATSTANRVAEAYAVHSDWYGGALSEAATASRLYETVNIKIVDLDGNVIYNDAQQDSDVLQAPPQNRDNVASAPIVADGTQVGTLYLSVFGSDTLLTQSDQQFRERSYQAMIFASVFALIIALVAGILFARALVRPINRITKAAQALKEGNYSTRTGMDGNDEISRLGNTFDLMADSIEANRKLERRLITDVAHELRTPLMAIQSTVEAMIDGVFDSSPERLETLNSEVRRLSRLVDALLKLSRLENRSTPIERKKVDLTELLSTIVETHKAYVNDAGLNLEFNYDPHVYVYGDADLLRQATANLISNAVRYTPEGGTITVTAHKGDIMGQIIVRDTGIGLTPEEAKMVFQRFWRADAGRTRATGGLGVGLTVLKEIVDRHNGWVRVEGRPNEGACFTIYIPLYDGVTAKRRKSKRNDTNRYSENGKNG